MMSKEQIEKYRKELDRLDITEQQDLRTHRAVVIAQVLLKHIEDSEQLISCAFCQQVCGSATELETHIKTCAKHPMAKLKEVLKFYADSKLYEDRIVGHELMSPIENDKGAKARQALQ